MELPYRQSMNERKNLKNRHMPFPYTALYDYRMKTLPRCMTCIQMIEKKPADSLLSPETLSYCCYTCQTGGRIHSNFSQFKHK